jgi:hypothetical protein
MTYLSTKKIYPGNWVEALNGWYKNIDTTGGTTVNASKDGPTSVLAIPGWRYFQQRGYVPVTWASGTSNANSTTYGQTMSVIIPSPYRQDDTRPDITGMVISGDSTQPAYVYRSAISIAAGWGDNRVASGIYASTGNVIAFGRDNSGSPVAASGEPVAAAFLTSTVSGDASTRIFFSGASQAFSSTPLLITSGTPTVTGACKVLTGGTTFKVYAKASGDAISGSGGVYLSDADAAAGLTGYILVEACYIVPDNAPEYVDIEAYLPNRTVS